MKKAMLLASLLAGLALANTKSFTVTLYEPAVVGGTELKAGDYKCELRDQKLVIKHGHETTEALIADAARRVVELGWCERGQRVGITAGLPSGRPGTTSLFQIQVL